MVGIITIEVAGELAQARPRTKLMILMLGMVERVVKVRENLKLTAKAPAKTGLQPWGAMEG